MSRLKRSKVIKDFNTKDKQQTPDLKTNSPFLLFSTKVPSPFIEPTKQEVEKVQIPTFKRNFILEEEDEEEIVEQIQTKKNSDEFHFDF